MTTKSVRRAALGGVVGPVAFVGSWSVLGSLGLTLVGEFGGFFQRLGLTAGDAFIVASALAISRGAWDRELDRRRVGARRPITSR